MAIRYRRLGHVDLWNQPNEKTKFSPDSTLNPQSKNKFRDVVFQRYHEETTPEDLGITFPYPEYFVDSNGDTWKRTDFATNNEILQNQKRDRIADNTTDKGNTFDPPQKDKDAKISRPGTTPEGYIMSSTIKGMKDKGLLGR